MNDSAILFKAYDNIHGAELWRSDGTDNGTYMIKDISAGYANGFQKNYHIYDNGKLYFSGNDGTGYHLWVTDGTDTGTKKISTDFILNTPPGFTKYNGKIYFIAYTFNTGIWEYWVTDGTTSGTKKLVDILPNLKNVIVSGMKSFSGKLYFIGKTVANGKEIWVTDGTNSGTKIVNDLYPGKDDGIDGGLVEYNGMLYFWGIDNTTTGYALYSTDGTSFNRIKKIYNDVGWTYPSIFMPLDKSIVYDNKLYFAAADKTNNLEMWVTDGTTGGTKMVKDIFPGIGSSYPNFITMLNNKIIFGAVDKNNDQELWISDGTDTGTTMLKDINPYAGGYTGSSGITDWGNGVKTQGAVHNGILFFAGADTAHGTELWRTDGTDTGTNMVVDFIPGTTGAVFDIGIYAHGRNIWLTMSDQVHGYELFLWDGNNLVSVENLMKSHVTSSVYPNPNNGSFTIKFDVEDFIKGHLKVTDLMGRMVHDQSIARNEREVHLTLPQVAPGIYHLILELDGKKIVHKLNIQ